MCRIQAAKVLSVSTGGHAPSGSAPEGPKILLLPLTRKAERGGCFMTFEQVVLLLTLLGGAIYATFEITWKISNGKKK